MPRQINKALSFFLRGKRQREREWGIMERQNPKMLVTKLLLEGELKRAQRVAKRNKLSISREGVVREMQ